VQGRLQLLALAHVTPCRRALVHSRARERAEALVREAREGGWEAAVAGSASEVARACDLIVTATTARAPLFPADALRAGAPVPAVGADAPGKQELDPALFVRAAVVVVDSRSQTADHGELAHALAAGTASMDRVVELGEALADPTRAARRDGEVTLCDLTGVAVQDIVIAEHVLRRLGGG
jgi:ornithine cyclodeaminase